MSERKPSGAAGPFAAGGSSAAGSAFAAWIVLAAALPLTGCLEAFAPAPAAQAQAQFVRRPGVSIAEASVAFVSVDGPPPAISVDFAQSLAREAAAQDIVVVESKKARYLVRGYFSAYATADGAAVEFVWDVFNKDRQRAQRLSDILEVKGEGADPWRIAGEAAVARVAARSAEDLAAFLSNTPEATDAAPPQAAEGKPLSFAPVD
jgi:hypothetical protein